MFDSVKNVTKLLRIISAHDNQGDSKKEIDTKQEYEYLGAFLNGEEITERAGLLGYTVYTYADLSSDDKKMLLEKMKSMENKYGKWTNKFSGNAPLDSKTAFDYLSRYQNFQEK